MQPPQNNPFNDWYADWQGRTPLVTRSLLQMLGVSYLLSWFIGLDLMLSNIPFYTVLRFEVYRLALSPLGANSLLSLVFTFISFTSIGARLEHSVGSARFAHLVALLALTANVAFTAFCFLMAGLGTYEALFFQCQGFWVVLFALIAVECLGSQEPTRQLFMIPVQIPTPYYPCALFALFSLFGGPSLGLAFGLGAGYAYAYGQASGIQMDYFKPSVATVQGWERGCLGGIASRPGYVSAGSAQGSGAWTVAIPVERLQGAAPGGGGWGSASSPQVINAARHPPAPSAPPHALPAGDAEAGGGGRGFWPSGSGGKSPGSGPPSAATSKGFTFGGGTGYTTGGASGGGGRVDPEVARRARLAAVEGRSKGHAAAAAASSSSSVAVPVATAVAVPVASGAAIGYPPPSAPPRQAIDNSAAVEQLVAMGYGRSDAREALAATNGDVGAAALLIA